MDERIIKVMLVEDDEDDYIITRDLLEEIKHVRYDLHWFNNYDDAMEEIEKGIYDVYIFDYRLGDRTGLDLLRYVNEKGIETPVIILTGQDDYETDVEAMRWGASDYLVKGRIEPPLLERSIRYAIERKKAELKIKRQKDEIARTNQELSTLYSIITAVSSSIDMDSQLDNIIKVFLDEGIIDREDRCGLFLVDGDRLKLVKYYNIPETFVNMHEGLRVGDCLCGYVARTGELLIINDADKDERHKLAYREFGSHGHVIIPLKRGEEVKGVMFLYYKEGVQIKESKKNLFLNLGRQIGIAIDNAELYEKTKELSITDPLTGLANRRLMNSELKRCFQRARRYGRPFSLIMFDIDDFKLYNDTFGHQAGDRLLSQIGSIALKELRSTDLAFRYGGEEFLIILPETKIKDALVVAERLRRTIKTMTRVTISLGVSSYNDDVSEPEQILNQADSALYLAKRSGKDRVEMFCGKGAED
ncbi:MAG TPA: diguanylate cyclase [Nitrospirae bacterium]|nr:diguanylate cyclase [Nitrospirota bacterium]